ncbi:hypothetical protein B9T07_19125 [Limnospira fusiformis CCALA 023]|nr:hypothetical protein B9S53_25605 [Arthrospira sp. O9.13F]
MRMVRSALLISNRGVGVPTRRLFWVLQPYFMPERLAHSIYSITGDQLEFNSNHDNCTAGYDVWSGYLQFFDRI